MNKTLMAVVKYSENDDAPRGIIDTLESAYPDTFFDVARNKYYSTQNSVTMSAEYFMAVIEETNVRVT